MVINFVAFIDINFTGIYPLLFAVLASIVFVLFYLFKTSEVMNKKALAFLLTFFLMVFIAAIILVYVMSRPFKSDFHLTFFPLQIDADESNHKLEANVLWQTLALKIQNQAKAKAVILTPEWTKKIVEFDSLKNLSYLTRLTRRLNSEYFMVGQLMKRNELDQIKYELIESNNNYAVCIGIIDLVRDELSANGYRFVSDILDRFNVPITNKEFSVRLINSIAYEQVAAAQELFYKKKYSETLELAQQSFALDSSLYEACLLIGQSNFMLALEQKKVGKSESEHFQRAFDWLNKTIELDSSNGEAYGFIGEYYVYQERWSLAEENLTRAHFLNPQNPRLYLALSRLHDFRYKKLGYKNEEQLFRKAVFVNPCFEDAYLMLSDYYLFENKRRQAIDVLQQYLELNPNSVPVLMALGKIYLLRNDILNIVNVFNRVIKLEPDNADAYYNLGILYYNSKDYENAEQFLLRAIEINNQLNAHLYLAYLYDVQGKKEKAIEHLRERIRQRKGLDDEFAEEARKRLFDLVHGDSILSAPNF